MAYTKVQDITFLKYVNGYASGQKGYVEPTEVTVRGRISKRPTSNGGYFTIKSPELLTGQTTIIYTDIVSPAPIIGKGYP